MMEGTRNSAPTPAAADAVETEQRLADLYARVLHVPEVHAEDDFFILGGTSLTALDLLALIGEELQISVPARTFYRATTVRELAVEVHALAAKGQPAC
jgi:acyl carrier protein